MEKVETIKVSYATAIGSLMYSMVCTRSDTVYVVGVVSQFMSNPGTYHWATVKWILWYIKGTSSVCLRFSSNKPLLEGFTNSDMSVDVDTRRSTFGYVMAYARGVVSWQSRLQKFVTLSTTEAEYMVVV